MKSIPILILLMSSVCCLSAQISGYQTLTVMGGGKTNSTMQASIALGQTFVGSSNTALLCGSLGILSQGNYLTTSIRLLEQEVILKAYPNPTHDRVEIQTELDIESIHLLDAAGKEVMKVPGDTKLISLQHIVEGRYFLKVNIKNYGAHSLGWIIKLN